MRIWCEIIKVNLRHHFPAPFLSAACIMTLTILLFPVAALRGEDVSKPLEYLFAGTGLRHRGCRRIEKNKRCGCLYGAFVILGYRLDGIPSPFYRAHVSE